MQDAERAIDRIQTLKGLEIAIAIDDSGTGYSSPAHVKHFSLGCPKGDGYFVKDIQGACISQAAAQSQTGATG